MWRVSTGGGEAYISMGRPRPHASLRGGASDSMFYPSTLCALQIVFMIIIIKQPKPRKFYVGVDSFKLPADLLFTLYRSQGGSHGGSQRNGFRIQGSWIGDACPAIVCS